MFSAARVLSSPSRPHPTVRSRLCLHDIDPFWSWSPEKPLGVGTRGHGVIVSEMTMWCVTISIGESGYADTLPRSHRQGFSN